MALLGWLWSSGDGFLRSPRSVADTQRVVDELLAGLGAGGFANMYGFVSAVLKL